MDEPNKRAQEIFDHVIDLPEIERTGYLVGACGADAALREHLERMLEAEARRAGFMEDPTMDPPSEESSVLIGSMIGPYKLVEEIGAGGYGVVYLAEQRQPIERQVALKVIKLGMDTRHVIARFEAERQALALMDHPSIAKILDAGTTPSGRPYFAMDLVRGIPVTEYCNQRGLTTEERLTLFRQVCLAVHHAHQKGIIHRDLKPNNILVSTDGDQPVPVIIDFGIAKATQGRLTDKTLFTQFRQFVGTPDYMSPEQAQMSSVGVDTRSDIYSLGVLLYELLTGKKPLDSDALRKAGYEEICRQIREETVPKPSKRLTSLHTDELTTLAKQRRLTLALFTSSITGDLDWIVMKAVEKDVSRRYDSCTALAADIERYRRKEPVLAGPPSAIYHLRKFAQRHRGVAFATLGIALAIIAGVSIAAYGMLRAVEEKEFAELARDDARESEAMAQREKRRAVTMAYLADMRLAHEALLQDNLALARTVLARNQLEHFPSGHDPRHWEWRALWQQCQSQASMVLAAPEDRGNGPVVTSPDGQWAITSSDTAIRVWSLTTGESHGVLPNDFGFTKAVFSPSGDVLYVNQGDLVRSWTFPSLEARPQVFVHDRRIVDLAVSPDGRWLVALGNMSSENVANLSVWSIERGNLRKRWMVSDSWSQLGGSLAISPDSGLLGVGPPLTLFDLETLEQLESQIDFRNGGRGALAFSADSRLVASATGLTDPEFSIHRVGTGESVSMPIGGHRHGIMELAFSPNGRFLASGSIDQSVVLWDATSFRQLATFRGHERAVTHLHFTEDSQRLLSCDEHTTCVWDLGEMKSTWPLMVEQAVYYRLPSYSQFSYSADGNLIAASSNHESLLGGQATLRSPETLELLQPLINGGRGLRFSPVDPQLLALSFMSERAVALLNVETGEEINRVTVIPETKLGGLGKWDHSADAYALYPVEFSDNGDRLLVLARPEPTVARCVIYSVPDLNEIASWNLPWEGDQHENSLALSADGKEVFASGSAYGGTRILEPGKTVEEAMLLLPDEDYGRMYGIDYSPDGKWLALVGGGSHAIHLVDVDTRKIVRTMQGHLSTVWSLRFSPDSQRIASGSESPADAAKVWDVATGREILTLEVEGTGFLNRQIEWSPDGNAILMMGGNANLYLWRVPSFEDIERAEARP